MFFLKIIQQLANEFQFISQIPLIGHTYSESNVVDTEAGSKFTGKDIHW